MSRSEGKCMAPWLLPLCIRNPVHAIQHVGERQREKTLRNFTRRKHLFRRFGSPEIR